MKKFHKKSWSKNADEIALHYAGTNALKRDYTRFGKRTSYGKLEDGINSGVRWYKGNFMDVVKCEGLRILFEGLVDDVEEEEEEGRKEKMTKRWREEFKNKRINRGGGVEKKFKGYYTYLSSELNTVLSDKVDNKYSKKFKGILKDVNDRRESEKVFVTTVLGGMMFMSTKVVERCAWIGVFWFLGYSIVMKNK